MFEVLQRNHVICTTQSRANAEDITEALSRAFWRIPFSWREVS